MIRTIVFFDGQHLYRSAKDAWRPLPAVGHSPYSYPSYDVVKLAGALSSKDPKRKLKQIRFYTGVPDSNINTHWHTFWTNKLRYLKSQGVITYKGRINMAGQEKGVDVKIAIDLVQLAYNQEYDAAIIVSQDWDFGSAVFLSKEIAKKQGRQLVFESHFPVSQRTTNFRGVPGTGWFYIDQVTYDACFDPTDYTPMK